MAISIMAAAIALSLTGCATRTDYNDMNIRSTADHGMNNYERTIRNDNVNTTRSTANDSADKLHQSIVDIKGVSNATVFVHDKNVIVGLDIDNVQDRERIEKQVKQAVQKSEKGYQVYVTSDKNTHARIHNMKDQMAPLNGNPMRDMGNDVEDLIKDIGNAVTAPFR